MPKSSKARDSDAAIRSSARLTPHPAALCVGARKSKIRQRHTLLWIDDFAPGLAMYKTMSEREGFKVLTASSGIDGIRLATRNYVDVVITDYEMPEMDGEAVAAFIKSIKPSVPVLMFSGSTCRFLYSPPVGAAGLMAATPVMTAIDKPAITINFRVNCI